MGRNLAGVQEFIRELIEAVCNADLENTDLRGEMTVEGIVNAAYLADFLEQRGRSPARPSE